MEKTILTLNKLARAKKESSNQIPVKPTNKETQPKNEENNIKQTVPAIRS